MSQLLKPGQMVRTETSGVPIRVEAFLGGGGQGEVYRADMAGTLVALKWYFPNSATPEQRNALETLVKRGAPSDRFLWPLELASASNVLWFGYVMPLREDRYKSLLDLMKRRIEPSFRALATTGMQLAHNFFLLHAKGLCYRDISFGNVFFDPVSGDVLICDNDNVAINGAAQGGVLGTQRFMAPEIVRGEAAPSTQTDLFSLAVLLFYLLMVSHPLDGKRESAIRALDPVAMTKLYGTDPLFIFDSKDHSNAPDPQIHGNALAFWPIYPQFLRDLFIRAFTSGLHDPAHGRVGENEWRGVLSRLRDAIVYCVNCGTENFYDLDALQATGGQPMACWSCHRPLQYPARIRIEKKVVMLNHDAKLYPHHVDPKRPYDFGAPVAEVVRHPTDPNVWGLKNLSHERWVSTTVDGTIREVEPGRSVTLAVGARVHFGTVEGEIRL